jgi:stage II sporulation protein P
MLKLFNNKKILYIGEICVLLFFAVWSIKSGYLKQALKNVALDSAFMNCPLGIKETSYAKIQPDGFLKINTPSLGLAYDRGLFIKNSDTKQTEQFYNYLVNTNIEEEKTPEKPVTESKAKPILMVNLKPNSTEGYLIYDNVYAKNDSGKSVDIKAIMESSMKLKISKASKGPQVLILHTHATESFNEGGLSEYTTELTQRSTDDNKNITAVGAAMAKELETAGVKVIQDKKHHDSPLYNGAYSRSYDTANFYLKKYPTIKVIIDIHRDSIVKENGETYRPVIKIGDKNAAQMMIIVGTGSPSLPNTHWKENLKLAAKIQKQIETINPGLCRPILLKDARYNMNISDGALLIEVGSWGNTLDEVKFTGQLAGKSLAQVINKIVK